MPVEPQKPYISSKEAAKKYDLTHDHIGLLCRRGKIQGLLWGRVWYVSEPSLVDYLKKNSEIKETRRRALSKQWRTAWTAAFLAFALFSVTASKASAQYVTPAPKLHAQPTVAQVSVASVASAIGEIRQEVETIQVPELGPRSEPVEEEGLSAPMLLLNAGAALFVIGEKIVDAVSLSPKPAMAVVYANDYAPEAQEANQLADVAAAAKAAAIAAIESVPAPDLSYEPRQAEPLITGENLMAGTIAANEIIAGANEAMFAAYADSASQLARIAQFDAEQAWGVYDRIFGEFGRQYVSDLSSLNDKQVKAYFAAGDAVYYGYNKVADAIDAAPSFDSSISVASVNYASPDLAASVGEVVGGVWNGAVEYLSDAFVSIADTSNKLVQKADTS